MLRSALLITTLLAISTTVHAEVSDIDSAVLERLVASGVPVIDIRTPEEWRETGVIEGSYLQTFLTSRAAMTPAPGWRRSNRLQLPINPLC